MPGDDTIGGGLEKLIDRMQAPLTKEVSGWYQVMVEEEEAWVRALDCPFWHAPDTLRRTIVLVPPGTRLPPMENLLESRQTFHQLVASYHKLAGKQSTSPPQWILPGGQHQPVTAPLPDLPGSVIDIRHSKARAFRSGQLEEAEVMRYLDDKISRQEEIVAGYRKRRQHADGDMAEQKLEEARLAVAQAKRDMTEGQGPYVGRLTSGSAMNYTARWSNGGQRGKFTVQHVALVPVAPGTGIDIIQEAPRRPTRTSDWGEPVVEVLGIAIYSLADISEE